MALFTDRPKIFRDKALLETDHLPDQFEGRQEELDAYQDALYPVYLGEKPKNLFLHGESGTGKTSMTKYILEHLEEDAKEQDVEVTSVYVSCNSLKNSYQLAREITNTLREQRLGHNKDELPRKGYSKADMFDFLFAELEKTTGTILIVLDELNNVEKPKDLLYEIPRAHSTQRLSEDTNLPGLIGISNDVDYLSALPPKVVDTLNDESIRFDPYNAPELGNILHARAPKAFYSDVLEDGVIERCAARTAQENGSARRALDLLRIAGELTRNEHADTVTQEHVLLAEEKLDRDHVKESINAGTTQTQLALLAVSLEESRENTPERTSNLHSTYQQIADDSGHRFLKHDRFRQRLDTLNEQNLINRNKKNDSGQYSEYWLDKNLLVILDALSSEPEFLDTIKECVNHAYKNKILCEDDIDTLEL